MRIAKLKDTQFFLNNWFIVLMALFLFTGLQCKVVIIFISVLLHEMAHAIAACFLGYKVLRIELLPFGGVATIENIQEMKNGDEMLIAAAGPFMSLCCNFVSEAAIGFFPEHKVTLEFISKANLMLACFNLLPGLPLDGGRILRSLLGISIGFKRATRIAAIISRVIGVALFLVAVYDLLVNNCLNFTLLLVAVFLFANAKAEIRSAGFSTMRAITRKRADLAKGDVKKVLGLIACKDTTASQIVEELGSNSYSIIFIVDEKYNVCGTITETVLWEGIVAKGYHVKLSDFL